MNPRVRRCRAGGHPRAGWEGSGAAQELRPGRRSQRDCKEAVGTAHGASATIPSFRPLHLGDGRWSHLHSSSLARPPGLCLARWPEFSGARGLCLWLLIGRSPRLLQDVPCCAPSCPPYHSCRRPGQHSSCLSHGPRPRAAFPPAWPRDQPPSIPPCCLSLYLSRILQMYSYCLYRMAAISQRKSPILKLALFPFCLFLNIRPTMPTGAQS